MDYSPFSIFIYPLLYIFPAYVANAVPVIFGGGASLDFKKKIGGKRLFGDNKTIKGTVSSLIFGILTGAIESIYIPSMLPVGISLTIGANFGDLLGSFIKRRIDLKHGASLPIVDQYGFFVFAILFAFPLDNLPNSYGLIFITIITGILHPLANVIANKLKLKSVPW